MGEESVNHVPPMLLWGYTCGSAELIEDHFDHLSSCGDCQGLVCQFIDVLEEIAAKHKKKVA
jgi:hypothetical protein